MTITRGWISTQRIKPSNEWKTNRKSLTTSEVWLNNCRVLAAGIQTDIKTYPPLSILSPSISDVNKSPETEKSHQYCNMWWNLINNTTCDAKTRYGGLLRDMIQRQKRKVINLFAYSFCHNNKYLFFHSCTSFNYIFHRQLHSFHSLHIVQCCAAY
jgi:hypothetical protein